MNIFNRAVVVLQVVLLIVLLIVMSVVPFTVLERLQYTAQQVQDTLQLDWPRSYVILLLAAVLLIALLVLLLWLEIRPQAKRSVTVRGSHGTEAVVSTESVAQSLQYHIREVPDVFKVKPTVRGKRSGLDIVLDLETRPEIDIPSKMEEVSQAARDLVESKMGLRIANIKVQVKHGPYGKVPEAQVAPPAPPTAPSALPEMSTEVTTPAPAPSDIVAESGEPEKTI